MPLYLQKNPLLCLQSTQHGTQGFGKAGVFVKSRAEPPTGDAALYKGRSLSSLKASPAWYALRVGGAGDCIKYPPCCASSRGRVDLLR
nr:MAG TPA: hypothetical protein [Caudoviricetes sp.]